MSFMLFFLNLATLKAKRYPDFIESLKSLICAKMAKK
ncbi:MAG: hypothetical protein ALAOOOJD_00720 [bacterium]|nr:hypothetical protein [bacterium]